MAFQVEEYAFEVNALLNPLLVRVRKQDRPLADQLFLRGYCTAADVNEALLLLDRVIAMLWKLTHR